ncbi:MAG TPA: hypothetical protein VK593_09570, partial [Edaphobacter sp.]|nr:hypothetical protein [Edaphobacter sp.]
EVFGNYYGTAVSALRHAKEQGKDLLLDIDVQGALQVMRKMPQATSIFILPPSPEVLEKRLKNRSAAEKVTDDVVIQKRLAGAKDELKKVWDYKYALVNDVLENAVAEMRAIVLAERGEPECEALAKTCRTNAASPKLKAVLDAFGD